MEDWDVIESEDWWMKKNPPAKGKGMTLVFNYEKASVKQL